VAIVRAATSEDAAAEAGVAPAVGSVGDSYDNALAETTIGLFKTELILRRGRGAPETRSNSRRSSGSTGSTPGGWTSRSDTFPPPSSRSPTTTPKPRH
jgi:transposase InsO family protein